MAGLLFSLILSIIIDIARGENKRTIRDCLLTPLLYPLPLPLTTESKLLTVKFVIDFKKVS